MSFCVSQYMAPDYCIVVGCDFRLVSLRMFRHGKKSSDSEERNGRIISKKN